MDVWHLWVHVFTILVLHKPCLSLFNHNSTKYPWCNQLLHLNQQLFPHGVHYDLCSAASWKKQRWDCCRWDGVSCDVSRRRVIGLDLSSCGLTSIPSNTTLFTLSHLHHLNLGNNKFDNLQIPSEFRQLIHLTHLNLSFSAFGGKIPLEFYHLSNLESLDLSGNPSLTGDIQMLLGNMSKIREVFLSGVSLNTSQLPANMSSFLTHLDLEMTGVGGTLPASIFEKPNLKMLRLLSNHGITGSLPTFNSSSVCSIKELELSSTSISGRLPESIGNFMANLRHLGLSSCNFWGTIPASIGNMTHLRHIYLWENNFTGQLPSTISNLRHLTFLDFSHNYLCGVIPSSLSNISLLYSFDVSWNALTGPLPFAGEGQRLEKLSEMYLSHNSFQGMIPSWMLTLPSLNLLDLSFNRLTALIGMFNCQNLYYLDLSNNHLDIDQFESFYNLSSITSLNLSHNSVSEHVPQTVNTKTLYNLQSLETLDLSSCKITQIPEFLRNSSFLQILDLSNNKIHGPTPSWFNSISLPLLFFLNLSTNHLTSAKHMPGMLNYLRLDYNSLEETFPSSVCNMSELRNLILSNNKLRGEIPECIGNVTYFLKVVDLRGNQFQGKIPETIGTAVGLDVLQLNGNHLRGPLPQSLANCTSLRVLDLGNNMINDSFPLWLEALPKLKILILKSNRFHGSISPTFSKDSFSELQIIDLSHNKFSGFLPDIFFSRLQAMKSLDQVDRSNPYMGDHWNHHYMYSVTLFVKGRDVEFIKVLNIFTTIDLSSNNFQGSIPESIAYLYALRLLNLSHNNINGHIPPALGNLKELEQLDLSSNQLTGGIPQTLTNLTFLANLDVSQNHLVGPIPQGNQFSTFSNESYSANSGLCGAPLTRSCGDDEEPPSPVEMEEEEDDSGILMGFTWQSVVLGYGCGIVIGFILGNVMITWRKPICLGR